jgi:hypothetical protein
MVGWKDRRNNVEFIDLAPHNFALVHCRGDRITNSLVEEAKGGQVDVELSTMGSVDCLFHTFSVILICSLRTYAACLSGIPSLSRRGMSLSLSRTRGISK